MIDSKVHIIMALSINGKKLNFSAKKTLLIKKNPLKSKK